MVIQPGGGHKDVMARILDCMWVPLLEVKPGEYELIELNTKGKHAYTHLDNDRLREGLHVPWDVTMPPAAYLRRILVWPVRY